MGCLVGSNVILDGDSVREKEKTHQTFVVLTEIGYKVRYFVIFILINFLLASSGGSVNREVNLFMDSLEIGMVEWFFSTRIRRKETGNFFIINIICGVPSHKSICNSHARFILASSGSTVRIKLGLYRKSWEILIIECINQDKGNQKWHTKHFTILAKIVLLEMIINSKDTIHNLISNLN